MALRSCVCYIKLLGRARRRRGDAATAGGGGGGKLDTDQAKIKEVRKKTEEKKVELAKLGEEIKRLQIKEAGKLEGIEELEMWTRELEEGLLDVNDIVVKMAKASLI